MTRRTGLGRGLDALLPTDSVERTEARGPLRTVPLSQIERNPRQPRERFDESSLDELTVSVRELGILQPLLVRETAEQRYELVAGERRLRAARRAGLTEVPVLVVETDETGSLERAIVENLHREDLNPIEEAVAYRDLIEERGLTQEALGERLGRNRVTISNTLRLLELPVEIQRYLVEGKLTAAHGRTLLGLQGNVFQKRLAQRVVAEGMSVRDTEEQVRRYQQLAGGAAPGRRQVARSPSLDEAQEVLASRLQTRVRVEMGQRKGKITIDFASLDELERLLAQLAPDDARAE